MSISKQVIIDGKIKRIGNYAHVKKFRQNKKRTIVALAGGQCVICGYNRCIRNLHFHHLDPKQKLFGVSSGGHGHSLEKIKAEVSKCILVCANCHGEIHDGLIDPQKYKN